MYVRADVRTYVRTFTYVRADFDFLGPFNLLASTPDESPSSAPNVEAPLNMNAMPVIELVPVLGECDRDAGESVVSKFVRVKYAQHAHLLLQMMLMRRAVFLIDGIDESGTYREPVQDFITVELLEPGHKTIITSRHSGFSSDAFRQCKLVELLPLSPEQQAEMVRTRVPEGGRAELLLLQL